MAYKHTHIHLFTSIQIDIHVLIFAYSNTTTHEHIHVSHARIDSCTRAYAHRSIFIQTHPDVAQVGAMYNLELQGHEDAVVLAGDGVTPSWPPVVSCCIGKYLGPDFGYGLWTR